MSRTKMHIAGVRFHNPIEDGGESRQHILERLYKANTFAITVDLRETTYHNPDTNEDEIAIQCIEHKSQQVIGWIPREYIHKIEHHQMTGFLNCYKNTYSVQLYEQQKPSHAQYYAVKRICERENLPMPAYDKRAYAHFFAQLPKH